MRISISYARGAWTVFSSSGFVGVTGDLERAASWVKMLMKEYVL